MAPGPCTHPCHMADSRQGPASSPRLLLPPPLFKPSISATEIPKRGILQGQDQALHYAGINTAWFLALLPSPVVRVGKSLPNTPRTKQLIGTGMCLPSTGCRISPPGSLPPPAAHHCQQFLFFVPGSLLPSVQKSGFLNLGINKKTIMLATKN